MAIQLRNESDCLLVSLAPQVPGAGGCSSVSNTQALPGHVPVLVLSLSGMPPCQENLTVIQPTNRKGTFSVSPGYQHKPIHQKYGVFHISLGTRKYSRIQKALLKHAGLKEQFKGPPGAEGNLCESSEASVHPRPERMTLRSQSILPSPDLVQDTHKQPVSKPVQSSCVVPRKSLLALVIKSHCLRSPSLS